MRLTQKSQLGHFERMREIYTQHYQRIRFLLSAEMTVFINL
jgi:hypothetical protein